MATCALVASRLAPPPARAYKSTMARRESRQARAARTEAIFGRLAAANPTPKGELKYINPFTLLVAVVLSAQATDAGVNKATRALFAVADTPEKMAALGEERLTERIKTVGLYRTKTKNIIAHSRHSRPLSQARASLADPARAIRLPGAQAVVRRLRARRSLPVRTEKPGE